MAALRRRCGLRRLGQLVWSRVRPLAVSGRRPRALWSRVCKRAPRCGLCRCGKGKGWSVCLDEMKSNFTFCALWKEREREITSERRGERGEVKGIGVWRGYIETEVRIKKGYMFRGYGRVREKERAKEGGKGVTKFGRTPSKTYDEWTQHQYGCQGQKNTSEHRRHPSHGSDAHPWGAGEVGGK